MGVGRWDGEGGRGRKEKRWRQSKLLPNLWGHLTASDHLASSSSLSIVVEGAAKSQVSG